MISGFYTSEFIRPASYIGLVLYSTTVATACKEYLWGYADVIVTGATAHAVAAEYSHSTV